MKCRFLISGLLLTGCTVGPNYQRPETSVPPAYAESQTATSTTDAELASWWKGFGDPLLDRLVAQATAHNLDVEFAAARVQEARAAETAAGTESFPQIGATGSVTRQRISENAFPVPPGAGGSGSGGAFGLRGTEFTNWRAGFDASWEIDLFGKNRRSIEAAHARSEASIWSSRDAQVIATAETAAAYLNLRTIQQRSHIARTEVERQERSTQLVGARVRGGLVTGQDLAQQQSQLAAAKAAIAPLEAQAKAEIHALGVLTGQAPEALIPTLSADAALPLAPAVPPGLPSELLRRRPDIRAAERNLHAATADIGVATADLYPRFSLTAAPALVSTALGKLLEWGSRSFSAGGSVNWPLFNGGRTRANIAIANARQEQALIRYRQTILNALRDVEDALSNIESGRRAAADLATSLSASRRAEDLARTRYRGGLVTYSDVLQAQAARISLENQLMQQRGMLARDTVALFKALGGGWTDPAQVGSTQP